MAGVASAMTAPGGCEMPYRAMRLALDLVLAKDYPAGGEYILD